MSFTNLNLHPKLLKALKSAGYETPTEVQQAAIPEILGGGDLRASAQTGTGKTAAFLLPAIHRLVSSPSKGGNGPRILILVPTRELADQIQVQAQKYTKYLPHIKAVSIVGGVPYHKQAPKLKRSLDILIATPGRLMDFIEQKKIEFSRLEMLILDEADRMLDMGFIKPVEKIASYTPEDRQTLLFSATLHKNVIRLCEKLLKNSKEISVATQHQKHAHIDQKIFYVDDKAHKSRLLNHLLEQEGVSNTIVFTSTKRQADRLHLDLKNKGFLSGALHGDMRQRERKRTIGHLRDGKINILVATDIAARGIDIQAISHIINFDLPDNAEDYVHRIGRTGRAGALGTALTFVASEDRIMMKRIEKFTGQSPMVDVIPGLEPNPVNDTPKKNPRFRPQNKRKRGAPMFAKKRKQRRK